MKVEDLINEINKSRNENKTKRVYDTKSRKDELAVMKAMLNDKTYEVDVYNDEGNQYSFSPSKIMRNTLSNIISSTTGMSNTESTKLMDEYEFKTSDAKTMIEFSKEYINTYLKTGRKLPLGGREKSNVALIAKTIPGGTVKYPVKTDKKDKDGKTICDTKEIYVEPYETVKVFGPCPNWLKNKDE